MNQRLALIASMLLSLTALKAAEPAPFNTILGTRAISGRYHFTQEAPLLESGKLIAELGSGIMKFSISRQASFGKTKANGLERDPSLKPLTDVAGKETAHWGGPGHAVHAFSHLGLPLHHARQRG